MKTLIAFILAALTLRVIIKHKEECKYCGSTDLYLESWKRQVCRSCGKVL